MCFVRPALLYLNLYVLKVFYEQINYYYYYNYYIHITICCAGQVRPYSFRHKRQNCRRRHWVLWVVSFFIIRLYVK